LRGLSVSIFAIIMLVMLSLILIPAVLIFSSTGIYGNQGQSQASAYSQLRAQEVNQVFRGNPNIYYNSSLPIPSLQFIFTSSPYPLNVTQIYYFSPADRTWVPVLGGSFVVSFSGVYFLPKAAFNDPLILVTGQGNIFFLNPNTSVSTVTVSGPSGKVPVYVTAFMLNGSKLVPASVQMTFGGTPFTSPQIFYVNPGNYPLTDKASLFFSPTYGLTGSFQNWSVAGYGHLSSTNALSTYLTVSGPVVVTAIYKASLQTFTVKIVPQGIPLGTTQQVQEYGYTASLKSLNSTIPVIVDNRSYSISNAGITLTLTYGYHSVVFPINRNVTFDFTWQGNKGGGKGNSFTVQAGQITTYNLTGLTSNTSKIGTGNYVIFVNGSGTVYGNYVKWQDYFLMIASNSFSFPSGVKYTANSTPVLGNLAGQLLQLQYTGTSNSFVVGPLTNFVSERLYFKASTSLNITLDYLSTLDGSFTVNGKNYITLLSYPLSNNAVNLTYVSQKGPQSVFYSPQPQLGNWGTFNVTSPLILINYEQWKYGGVSP